MKTTPRWMKSVLNESTKAQPAMPWARGVKRRAAQAATAPAPKSTLRIAASA